MRNNKVKLVFLMLFPLFLCCSCEADGVDYLDPIFLINLKDMNGYAHPDQRVLGSLYGVDMVPTMHAKHWVLAASKSRDGVRYEVIGGFEPILNQDGIPTNIYEQGLGLRVVKYDGNKIIFLGGEDNFISSLNDESKISFSVKNKLMNEYVNNVVKSVGISSTKEFVCDIENKKNIDSIVSIERWRSILVEHGIFPCPE